MAVMPLGLSQGCAAADDDQPEVPEVEALRANWQEFVPKWADLPSASDKLLEVSKEVWRERLPKARFLVMFENDTEPAWSSDLLEVEEPGVFVCAACRLPLFTTPMKFHSGTGWPSFFTYIPGNLETQLDFSLIWPRTEYHCVRCGSHQGHLFDWSTPTGLRYCNNGLALQFLSADGSKA